MCGICGYQGAFDPGLIHRMTTILQHRGPDGEGIAEWTTPTPTGFGHRRLAIIDLSPSGHQPMAVDCEACGAVGLDDLALTYNGELYNYQELRHDLEAKGHRFRSKTDSEVLLHGYAEYGTDFLGRLNGIFAFAIRDGRTRGRPAGIERGDLFLARDQFGIKPLYHAVTSAGVVFASEVKAVLQAVEVDRAIDPVGVQMHLAYLWSPAPRTLLKGVEKLEPGYAMIVRGGRVARRWAYYDIPMDGRRDGRPEEAIAEELRARFQEAVRRQLVSDVPVGAFLSGGVDSTAVVAAMRAAGATPHCFAIGFGAGYDGGENPDDLPYARQAARQLGVPLTEIVIGAEVIRDLPRMLYYLDEPQADIAPINALLIAERAREAGIPVLLSGAGGDDLFAGYRRHRALRLERSWAWLPRPMRQGLAQMAGRMAEGTGRGLMHRASLRRIVKAFTFADLEPDPRLASYLWWSPARLRERLYSPAIRAALGAARAEAPMLASLGRIPDERDRLNRMLYLEMKHFLPDHNLNYTDRMGMACGVEVRVPFLDPDLVVFSTTIPPAMKLKCGETKAIFKRAVRGMVPEAVLRRPKSGFGAPLRTWMRNDLRPMMADTLSPDAVRRRGLFDPTAVQELARLDTSGTVDGSYTLLALMSIELWCRMFVDKTPTEAPPRGL